ncbi:MAG TPA: TolC family protein [Bdellovibrionota bacterium]|nr:TolC family protein [Bdellovibrionota bacterium]
MRRFIAFIVLAIVVSWGRSLADSSPIRLSLQQAIERARLVAPRLKQLSSLAKAAEASTRAASAGHWPSLNASAGYTRNSGVPELVSTPPGGPPTTIFPNIPDNYRTRVEMNVPLFTGGKVSSTVDSARALESGARKDLTSGESDLTFETTRAYWDLVTAAENQRVLKEALQSYEAHLVDAKNRKRVGMAATNEVLQVQVERDQSELTLIRAQNARQVSEANLRRILDYPSASIEPADPLETTLASPAAEEDLVARAFRNRPDRAALVSRWEAARAWVNVQKSTYWPQLNAVGGYDYSNPNRKIAPPTAEFEDTWDVGVNMTMNLFEGGKTKANVDQARAQAEALRQQLADTDERIHFEVTSRLMNLQSAVAAFPVAERTVESAKENVSVARNRYRAGVIPSSELLDAETSALRAGLSRADVLARIHVAQADLNRAVGD